uniref:Uncharacterized protein n=1 Tax=Lepeophtheirus salmonis TaxID=72036 RepID=A0A0K2TUI2_LEPSM
MSEQKAKRQRISDLLDAQVGVARIIEIVKCSRSLVYKVAKIKNDGKDLSRKAGSGGHNLKRDREFLSSLEKKIMEDPTKSMNCLASDFCVAARTIRRAVKGDLGLSSYTSTPRHLLTEAMKARRLDSLRD